MTIGVIDYFQKSLRTFQLVLDCFVRLLFIKSINFWNFMAACKLYFQLNLNLIHCYQLSGVVNELSPTICSLSLDIFNNLY